MNAKFISKMRNRVGDDVVGLIVRKFVGNINDYSIHYLELKYISRYPHTVSDEKFLELLNTYRILADEFTVQKHGEYFQYYLVLDPSWIMREKNIKKKYKKLTWCEWYWYVLNRLCRSKRLTTVIYYGSDGHQKEIRNQSSRQITI